MEAAPRTPAGRRRTQTRPTPASDAAGQTDVGGDAGGSACGDGRRDTGELCDGDDLGGQTCEALGFDSGTLACNDTCDGYDFDACETDNPVDPVCGNGVREPGELCDGADVGDAVCTDFGFDGGDLACADSCDGYSFAGCTRDECVPECGGRECGPDPVCGESCGSCDAETEFCDGDGICQPATGSPPVFITFDSNVLRITEGEAVRFTAVVTDPDGIDDLIGGTLRDPVSRGTYGSFTTSAAEGSYQIEVTWADVQFIRSIDFTRSATRTFEAEFFDQDGNRVVESIEIELYCVDGDVPAACGGECRDFGSVGDCGGCDVECIPNAECAGTGDTRSCGCPAGFGECDGVCEFLGDEENCGSCGNVCDVFRGGFCDGTACACPDGFNLCGTSCGLEFEVDGCGAGCGICTDGETCNGFECVSASNGALRINGEFGVLEVLNDGSWRGICDDSFSEGEAVVACRQLGGELVSYSIGARGPSANFWLDDLGCIGSESRIAQCFNGTNWGDEDCSSGEHVALVCTPVELADCDPATNAGLVINEAFINPVGADGSGENEFIELSGPSGMDLTGLSVANYNGSDLSELGRTAIPEGTRMPADGYLVIGGSNISEADIALTYGPQNGPDWLRLERCDGSVVDALGYGDGGFEPNTLGEGNWARRPADGETMTRDAASTDTDNNGDDFFFDSTPTPGARRGGTSSFDLPIAFSLSATSGSYSRANSACEPFGVSGFVHNSAAYTNTSGSTVLVDVYASYDDDGYLFVYDGGFDPERPTENCIAGNDDFTGTSDSLVESISWSPGQTIVVVVSTYFEGDTVNASVEIRDASM